MDCAPIKKQESIWTPALLFAAVTAMSLFLISQGLDPQPIRFVLLLVVLVKHGLYAGGWLAAAAGWGWPIRRVLGGGYVEQVAVGVGTLALLDCLLGWAGWLDAVSVWVLGAVGWALLALSLRAATVRERARGGRTSLNPLAYARGSWWALLAAPAVGLLLGAACIAPGILWRPSEAGGYDALEYHLQLPAEWARLGAVRGLEHNAYSWMPDLFEAAYTHLCVWEGTPLEWALAAQLLHASMTILAAVAIAKVILALTDSVAASCIAAALYLSIPWTLVTGSLAYNDQAAMALGAAALGTLVNSGWLELRLGEAPASRGASKAGASRTQPQPPARAVAPAILAGLLCGLATLVKLTAAGTIAAPLALLMMLGPGRFKRLAAFTFAAALPVTPWLVRNALATGNPVFPMFPNLLGAAHWTTDQSQRWTHAHNPAGSPLQALALLFSASRGLFHDQFAYAIVPLAALGAWRGLMDIPLRRTTGLLLAVLGVQLTFWLLLTHHQSRFLVPLLLPVCVLVSVTIPTLPFMKLAAILTIAVAAILSLALYLFQTDGLAPQLIGRTETLAREFHPYAAINSLPPGSRVYSEGFATPFYVRTPMTYHTVWDRSPLGERLTQGGPPAAAAWLRAQGYSHVVIDWGMIQMWNSPGNYGYDPRVTLDSLQLLARNDLDLLTDQPDRVSALVYRVKPD